MPALAGGGISWTLFNNSLGCSERGEKSVCGKNLCGFFLRDLNQSRRGGRFAQQTGVPCSKRKSTALRCSSFWSRVRESNSTPSIYLVLNVVTCR